MPVDHVLLLEDPTFAGEVLSSQIVRYGMLREKASAMLEDIQLLEMRRRSNNKAGAELRAKVNSIKKLASSQRRAPQGEEREETDTNMYRSTLSELRQRLLEIEKTGQEVTAQLADKVTKIGNTLDDKAQDGLCHNDDSDGTLSTVGSKPALSCAQTERLPMMPLDPVFCIGGYEETIIDETQKVVCLQGPCLLMARACINRAVSYWTTRGARLLCSPSKITLEMSVFRSLFGCPLLGDGGTSQKWEVNESGDKNRVLVPTFLFSARRHKAKTYWDRELPLREVHLIDSPKSGNNGNVFQPCRVATGLSAKVSSRQPWFERCQHERVELFGLTTSRLEESRRLQASFAQDIRLFFLSLLLVQSSRYELISPRVKEMVILRTTAAKDLFPCETGRIRIEGFLRDRYVLLGYVSNFTDYMTRALKVKCGGMHVEYTHSVGGLMMGSAEAMEWMVQNNVIRYKDSLGVGVPGTLSTNEQPSHSVRMIDFQFHPFIFRMEPSKKPGKPPVVTRIKGSTGPSIVYEQNELSNDSTEPNGNASMNKGNETHTTVGDKDTTPFAWQDNEAMCGSGAAQAEVLSLPFGFLPM